VNSGHNEGVQSVAKIIALVGQKGGTGKTTTAIALAVEWVVRRRSVLLVDLDTQGSVLTWADWAGERNAEHIPAVTALGAQLRQQLAPHLPGRDVVIIDCPPSHGERQRAAMMAADVALLPAGPDATEVWGLTTSADLVRDAIDAKPQLRAALVITRKDRRTALGAQARQALEALRLPVLDAELSRRVTYPESIAAGRGPTTYDAASVAAREVRRLANELEQLLGLPALPKPARRGA